MQSKENKERIKNIIRTYKVGHWLYVNNSGIGFRQLVSEKNLVNWLIAVLLFGVVIFIKLMSYEPDPWVYWMFGATGLLTVLVFVFVLNRELSIDLEKGEAVSSIWGIKLSRKPLTEFKRFTAEGGLVVNGLDTGGHLYMQFEFGRIRIATFRNEQDFYNLQYTILEIIQMDQERKTAGNSSELQSDIP
jgi:hypothetical protein